jgi:hypothetical protein
MTAISITLIALAVVAMILGTAQVLDPGRRLYGILTVLAGFTSLLVLAGLNEWGIAFAPIDVPWKAALAVVSLASIVVGFATTRTVFTTVGFIGLGLTAFFVLGQPWWVMALAIATGLFVALDAITDRAIFALAALVTVVGMLASATYDMRSVRDALGVTEAIEQATAKATADLKAELKKGLDAARVDPTSLETECKSMPNLCALVKSQGTRITALEADNAQIWATLVKARVALVPGDMDTDAAAENLAKYFASVGFTQGQVVTGNSVDYTLPGANEAGRGAFGDKPLRSVNDVLNWWASPQGAESKQNMLDYTPAALHDYFLSGKGVIPFQIKTTSCNIGNWSKVDGKADRQIKEICHSTGDVWWVPVAPDGTVYMAAATRGACLNPHLEAIYPSPATPGSPKKPTVCGPNTDFPGQPLSKGCWKKNPTPKKVPVCTLDGKATIWVPATEASKYPKPNGNGTCTKANQGGDPGLNPGEGGSGGVNGNNGATDSRGQQNDPAADAAAAAAKAEAERKAAEEAAKKAAESASTDSGAGDTPQGPSSGSPTGNGGDQSGGVWGH